MAGWKKRVKRQAIASIRQKRREQERKRMPFLADQPTDSDAWLHAVKPHPTILCDEETWAFLHTANHLRLLREITPCADSWTPQDEVIFVWRGGINHVA